MLDSPAEDPRRRRGGQYSCLTQPWLHIQVATESGSAPTPGIGEWALLSYQLPREPSTPRIALWRRLRRLGVAQLADGLVALPADPRTREQLEWLAEDVRQAAGVAGVWSARPTTSAQQRALMTNLAAARATEYRELTGQALAARLLPEPDRAKAVSRLRRHWREITRRDFFPPVEREAAAAALRDLAACAVPGAPDDVETAAEAGQAAR